MFNWQWSADKHLSWVSKGKKTDLSLWIMGGCDFPSAPLVGFSSGSFCGSARSLERLWLVESPNTRKESIYLHKYRHKCTWTWTQMQSYKTSPQKSSQSLVNTLSLRVSEQSLRPNHDSAPRTLNFINYHVKHFNPLQKLNNLQSSSSPAQTLLT